MTLVEVQLVSPEQTVIYGAVHQIEVLVIIYEIEVTSMGTLS